jgi:hypothetical protein
VLLPLKVEAHIVVLRELQIEIIFERRFPGGVQRRGADGGRIAILMDALRGTNGSRLFPGFTLPSHL